MQSSPEDPAESSPVAVSAAEHQQGTETQPTQSKPDEQKGEDKPDPPAQTTSTAEAPTSMALTPSLEKEPGGTDADPTAKPGDPPEPAADSHISPGGDGQEVKKQGKGDGRKYVPSKKAMVDPLKMDMSKSVVMPLSSSQLSLHCIECHIIFSDLKGKERHMKHSHPAEYEQCILRNSLFACYVCDRHFTNSAELMAHQKAHPDKKPFKCPICSLSFKKSSELTAHKKIHFGQDGYACKDCGKSCKTLTLLKYHQRKHSGEKPYVCKECGKRFPLSKALQKHVDSHSLDGAEGVEVGAASTAAVNINKTDGASPKVYICSVCKAIFKSFKTRQHHLITKHKLDAVTNPLRAGLQSTPIITPISISQPALLQVEPNGPLQKVDANIDTEQIRKLIESLGNVQKVNQVVILGQVPPHAPPLQVQQVSEPAETVNLNLGPPQIDFIGLKPAGSKTVELDPSVNLMEQTIILEPITPEEQLETPSFSDLGSHVAAGEHIELTLIPSEQSEGFEGEAMHQNLQQDEINPMNSDTRVCQNEVADLKENLEQTVILEFTPALIPAAELEQSQTEPQNEVISSSLVQSIEQETPDQAQGHTVEDPKETNMPVPPLTPTAELELASTHPEEQDLSSCPSAPPETLTQAPSESEATAKENINSDAEKVGLDQIPVINKKTNEKDEQDLCEKFPAEDKSSVSAEPAAKEEASSKLETKEDQQNSELPVSVMSAQELVKVRKRKPARTFFFQGYMHDLVGSIYKDDFQIDAKPAKRQRTKKSCLVVKFGPQGKDKKSKKQKKAEQKHQPIQDNLIKSKTSPKKLQEKVQKVQTPKKTGKGKKDKTENMSPGSDTKSPSTHTPQVKQVKDDAKKNKMKKQKETKGDVVHISEQKPVSPPMLQKKKAAKILQKDQPKSPKEVKGKKNLTKAQKVKKTEAIDSNINQDSLLLLKGHKQPQLKVYKLDTSKASGPTQEDSPHDSQSMDISTAGEKKKGGRAQKNQKGLSLLSSLQVTRQQPQIVPTKPKTTRKRKAPLNVETEGVITSKRALECKDCGEKFSEVASLQKHKTTAHIIESPGLTYTNGNIFEGVSGFDLYRLPKEHGGMVRVMNAPTDWDTEPEMGEMALEDRDRGVSFPALIPSPSLQIPPQDVEMSNHEHNSESKTGTEDHFGISYELQSSTDEPEKIEAQPNVTTETSRPISAETKSSDTGEPVASDEDKQEDPSKNPSYRSKVQGTPDEDVKEDLLLEVDLVTVGEEEEEKEDSDPQNESNRVYRSKSEIPGKNHKQVGNETREFSLTCQTVSCSTHRAGQRKRRRETLVQKRKETMKEVAVTGQSRRAGLLNRDVMSKTSSGLELEHDPDECWIIYEKQPLFSDLETDDRKISTKTQTSPEYKTSKGNPPVASLPSVRATVEESSEEAVASTQGSLTTGVEEGMNERGLQGEEERESDQSPGIILERFLTSGQRPTVDKETSSTTRRSNQPQVLGRNAENSAQVPGGHEIKVEENSSDAMLVATICQNRQSAGVQPKHHEDIRSVLVKEERNSVVNDTQGVQGSRHMRWNVEPVSSENTDTPLTEDGETAKDCRVTPDFNSKQCIFYPVKEEEREVLLGATQTSTGSSTPDGSGNPNPTDHQSADCNAYERRSSPPSYQESVVAGLPSEQSVGDLIDGQAALDSEWQHPSDLRDFLLQSSDDEDMSNFELPEPQLDKEAEIMAYFSQNQTSSKQWPQKSSLKCLSASARHLQSPHVDNRTEKPLDYFSEYFSWDTWVEIASCTNKLSKMPNPVTCREVARFVGIHIAMGTLKFPSARLYWEDLTKVSLIAEAMPLNRFLDLSRMLKLCSLNDLKENVTGQQLGNTSRSSQSLVSDLSDSRCSADSNSSQTPADPLWKVRPLLYRFNEGCRSLKQPGDYAVDQYPVTLTGKIHDNRPFLQCATLIGLNGLITHMDLELEYAEKQDAVEKMVPKGSTVFLCKQELSTPAMLEHLLAAGIHGAGRVEGARGQIGDEFVSSDGKLMLRRTHCGFILSTAGNGQRNMVSLIDSFEKAQMSARVSRDLTNLYSTPLTVSLPTCWPQAVLWHLTDVALVNSWLLYRQDYRAASAPLTLMAFRLEVSKALIVSSGLDTQDSIPPQPPEENAHHATSETPSPVLLEESPLPDITTRYDGSGHWPEQLAEGEGGRCRFGDCQRTSRVLCLKCCVFLCISRNHNCFLNFHNQESVGKDQ
ncbi:LOW QUALITY PROTEIN: zinc finger protein 576, tandem duplicate 1 [Anableps anableps]